MATRYMDLEGGSNAADATSYANRVRNITAGLTSARVAAGDECRMMASRRGSLSSCSITKGAGTLTVPSGNHKVINLCTTITDWTARTNVSMATSTTRAHGANSTGITPIAAFGTGELAYYDLGASTDLSSYSAIFVLLNLSASITTTALSLTLYSDVGTTVIETLSLIGPVTAPTVVSGTWCKLMFGDGTALPNNVRAIGISTSVDPGTSSFRLNNLIACHDPRVTANSITPWDAFASTSSLTDIFRWDHDSGLHSCGLFLSDTTLRLDHTPTNAAGTTSYVWPHATLSSATIEIWHGWPHDVVMANNNANSATMQRAGSSESVITQYLGGWNRTDMSTQDSDGLTVSVNQITVGRGLGFASWTKLSRYVEINGNILYGGSSVNDFVAEQCWNCCPNSGGQSAVPVQFSQRFTFDRLGMSNFSGAYTIGNMRTRWLDLKVNNLPSVNFEGDGNDVIVGCRLQYNTTCGLDVAGGSPRNGYGVRNFYGADNVIDLRVNSPGADLRMWNVSLNSATKISVLTSSAGQGGAAFCQNVNGNVNDCEGVFYGINTFRDTSIIDSVAVSSLRCLVNISSLTSSYPQDIPISRRVALQSIMGKTVTASIRYLRNSTNLSGRFVVKGGIIISTDQTTSLTASANVWTTATVSFVATSDGPISCHFEVWSTDAISSLYINPGSLTISVDGRGVSRTSDKWDMGYPLFSDISNKIYSNSSIG